MQQVIIFTKKRRKAPDVSGAPLQDAVLLRKAEIKQNPANAIAANKIMPAHL